MTLYLVRHGKALAGIDHPDPGLDALGHEQAQAAARALEHCGARRLVVSPLRRTQETAAPIAQALSLGPELDARVGEVADPSWTSEVRPAAIRALLASTWSEQPAALCAWRDSVLATLLELGSSADHVVVVSHYVAISVAIGHAVGIDRVAPGFLPNASITRFELVGSTLELSVLASVSHLSAEQVTGGHTALAGIR